jgi:hypothetical protein
MLLSPEVSFWQEKRLIRRAVKIMLLHNSLVSGALMIQVLEVINRLVKLVNRLPVILQ